MDEQWRYSATGSADNRIQGVLRRVEGVNAVALEFRIPLSLLGSRQYFGLTYVDVDDELPDCPYWLYPQQATEPFSKIAQDNWSLIPRLLESSCRLAIAASYSNVIGIIVSPSRTEAPSVLGVSVLEEPEPPVSMTSSVSSNVCSPLIQGLRFSRYPTCVINIMSVINNRDLFALAERALAILAGGHIPIIELSY